MESLDKSFLGAGWNFPPTFRREWYGEEMAAGEDAVRNSIEIILNTITGERVMLPNYGCNLQPHVFDQMNVPTVAMVEKIVKDALVYHEPRIIVESVVATPFQEEGRLEINVEYSIITTNTRYNYVFPFYMKEATNIVP
ncbi:GPW/gp25 family protein [Chitinophaga sp. CB10]|uniref:GPW/gp25 family protein n=1 Tax=Chitinophaga sp. CB10 TaxID=1891659 RepID=UPI000B09564E|nr:GPW/gp25 family protein [Chitinophaga sp. CB10]